MNLEFYRTLHIKIFLSFFCFRFDSIHIHKSKIAGTWNIFSILALSFKLGGNCIFVILRFKYYDISVMRCCSTVFEQLTSKWIPRKQNFILCLFIWNSMPYTKVFMHNYIPVMHFLPGALHEQHGKWLIWENSSSNLVKWKV